MFLFSYLLVLLSLYYRKTCKASFFLFILSWISQAAISLPCAPCHWIQRSVLGPLPVRPSAGPGALRSASRLPPPLILLLPCQHPFQSFCWFLISLTSKYRSLRAQSLSLSLFLLNFWVTASSLKAFNIPLYTYDLYLWSWHVPELHTHIRI